MEKRPDPVLDPLDRVEGRIRSEQPTVPDSDPPPVLSMVLSPDRSLRVRNPWIAALALILLAAVAIAWLGR